MAKRVIPVGSGNRLAVLGQKMSNVPAVKRVRPRRAMGKAKISCATTSRMNTTLFRLLRWQVESCGPIGSAAARPCHRAVCRICRILLLLGTEEGYLDRAR